MRDLRPGGNAVFVLFCISGVMVQDVQAFRQKSVIESRIEFTNAAKIHFLKRFLLPNANASSNL